MLRRRLRLSCSSDEEDDEEQQQQQQQQQQMQEEEVQQEPVTLTSPNSNPNPNPNINTSEALQISDDDDFIDVSDNLSPPSPLEPVSDQPSHRTSLEPPSSVTGSSGSSDCPIGDSLRRLGLRLRREWLDSCIVGLGSSIPGFASLDVAGKAKLCFDQFLYSDMNYSGGGVLPDNVSAMHLIDLAGPFVLQVDEIVNISCPLRVRYQNASSGIKRCLKLSLTDGVQRVFAMEYRPIKDLEVLAPAGLKSQMYRPFRRFANEACDAPVKGLDLGLIDNGSSLGGLLYQNADSIRRSLPSINCIFRNKKSKRSIKIFVAICNVNIRHGLLMLVPEVIEVLGGLVEELDAARQRLVHEVNKPPRGKRTRTGVVPSLATRATLAAWPSNGVTGLGHSNSSTSQNSTSFHANVLGARLAASGIGTSESNVDESAIPVGRENAEPNPSSNADVDVGQTHRVDEVEHPVMLTGDREIPFTYLASLSAKWASVKEETPSVQGKIKCFLTGVKGFQYKRRTMFELRVYVDDGSLISEILIDHNVVQKGIGYSPEEVTAALASSDIKIVGDMKETLKQFQIFLVNFEGTMLLEINETSPLPISLEMNQGCPASDAWLLLRRLKSITSAQTLHHPQLDPIDLSP